MVVDRVLCCGWKPYMPKWAVPTRPLLRALEDNKFQHEREPPFPKHCEEITNIRRGVNNGLFIDFLHALRNSPCERAAISMRKHVASRCFCLLSPAFV